MFLLALMKDEIGIHPSRFGNPVLDSVVEEIDAKYSNKVGEERDAGSPGARRRAGTLTPSLAASP